MIVNDCNYIFLIFVFIIQRLYLCLFFLTKVKFSLEEVFLGNSGGNEGKILAVGKPNNVSNLLIIDQNQLDKAENQLRIGVAYIIYNRYKIYITKLIIPKITTIFTIFIISALSII